MITSRNTVLANQAITCILLINNECSSTGLYQVPLNTVPTILRKNTSIPFFIKGAYLYAQLEDPQVTINLDLWTAAVYKIVISCIIRPVSVENAKMLTTIGRHFNYDVNLKDRVVRRLYED